MDDSDGYTSTYVAYHKFKDVYSKHQIAAVLYVGLDKGEAERIAAIRLIGINSENYTEVETWIDGKCIDVKQFREPPLRLCELLHQARQEVDRMKGSPHGETKDHPSLNALLQIRDHIKTALYAALFLPKGTKEDHADSH